MIATDFPPLSRLLSSNAQWATDVEKVEPPFFENGTKGQSPKVLWIGCADSRVPESVVTASRPGDIFVHRNIANQFHLHDDSALSVLTYAVQHLGVEHVIVVGHTNCGGAAGAFAASCNPPPPITPTDPLSRWLAPMIQLSRESNLPSKPADQALPILVEENVKAQVANIVKTEVMGAAWREGKHVYVHGWVYDLASGRLKDLNCTQGP